MKKQKKPFGSWKSPFSLHDLVHKKETISFPKIAPRDSTLYWTLKTASGRKTISSINTPDLLPQNMRLGTKIHEYGGDAYFPYDEGIVFSSIEDGQLYSYQGSQLKKISRSTKGKTRYADGAYDPIQKKWYFVREELKEKTEERAIICIDMAREPIKEEIVEQGEDFYANPTLSPDGKKLAFISWNKPDMPWQNTTLWIRVKKEGSQQHFEKKMRIAGGGSETIFQPTFSSTGALYFLSDRSGFSNLYVYQEGKVVSLHQEDYELDLPQWIFGLRTYVLLEEHIVCIYRDQGQVKLGKLSREKGAIEPISLPISSYDGLVKGRSFVYSIASFQDKDPALVAIDLQSKVPSFSYVQKPPSIYPAKDRSVATPFSCPTKNGEKVHGYFYPPMHSTCEGMDGEKPPVIMKIHSGPTASFQDTFSLETQFWTSRGFAYICVNYRGSTGYGRTYREKLYGKWGEIDVDDAVDALQYWIDQGCVDPKRTAIRGSSSGGYTALMAAVHTNAFQAAVSYYGICDLESLSATTHAFESGYNESLIGPYPEEKERYYNRSPIHFVERTNSSFLLFHGEKDVVVPKEQSERFADSLKAHGKQVELYLFPEQGHGFTDPFVRKQALLLELAFYQKLWGIPKTPETPKIQGEK